MSRAPGERAKRPTGREGSSTPRVRLRARLDWTLRSRSARLALAALAAAVLVFGVMTEGKRATPHRGAGAVATASAPALSPVPAPAPARTRAKRPNIVFVLTDDLSLDLLRYMPQVQALQAQGLTFGNYFVTDSLCCPSRSSIFTGNFPHDTGVFNNVGTHGGFHVFYTRGEEQDTFAVALQDAGYRTALMGKYLNGYMEPPSAAYPPVAPPSYVPPGWSEWDVAGDGYPEFGYQLNENGALRSYGDQPADYLTDVIARKGVDFIDRSAAAGKPFFLELATFAPHGPYVPAPRDANAFPGLTAPRPPSFDVLPSNPPGWLRGHQPLSPEQVAHIDTAFRLRAQSVQAVDAMIAEVERALAANHISRSTYIVFSSDNGLHTGEYRLTPGKLTAFDTDIHVPLVVAGPGVPAGTTSDRMASNIDLAKTFSAIGRTTRPGDGHSLLGLLHGKAREHWRNAILVEHNGPDLRGVDPDYQQPSSGSPRTYAAMRTHSFLYVQYNDGELEYYDLLSDPFELHNLAPTLAPSRLLELHSELARMKHCHNGRTCWAAMHVPL